MKRINILLSIIIILFSGCSNKESEVYVIPSTPNNDIINEATPTEQSESTEHTKPSETKQSISQSYIFPNSSKQLLTQADLFLYDSFTLKLAKNEIFARKGYIFKNEALKNYFNNMPWYEPNENIKGTFDELNDIEKQNVSLIEKYSVNELNTSYYGDFKYKESTIKKSMSIKENPYNLSYEEVYYNGKLYYKESVKIDLNYDNLLEELTIYFYPDCEDIYPCIIEIVDSNGKLYTQTYGTNYVHPFINIADFDIEDGLIQFYISQSGLSYDTCVQIFSFDGEKIITNIDMMGYVTKYDGMSKIYSFDEYSINCYYDLNEGLTILPKENIINSKIKADFNIQLFNKPFTESTSVVMSPYLYDNEYNGAYIDNYMGIVPKGTQMEVLDIEFRKDEYSNYFCVPWLKVKTATEMIGWYCLEYGD